MSVSISYVYLFTENLKRARPNAYNGHEDRVGLRSIVSHAAPNGGITVYKFGRTEMKSIIRANNNQTIFTFFFVCIFFF